MKDWKSTAAGILSFLVTTLTTLSGFLIAGNLVSGEGSIHVSTYFVIGINVALALCRAWVGMITNNADAGATAKAISDVTPINGLPTPTAATIATTPKP